MGRVWPRHEQRGRPLNAIVRRHHMASTQAISISELQAPPEFITADVTYDGQALRLRVDSTCPITIVELHGSKRFVDGFGGSVPSGFSVRQFADNVKIPPEMADDIAAINQSDFRWACGIPVAPGRAALITIPTTRRPFKQVCRGRFEVVYEKRKLLGLIREKTFFRLLLNAEKVAVGGDGDA